MARVVTDAGSLPERPDPIPGAKPPVFSLPYGEVGSPEEVDEFRGLIHELRRQSQSRPR